MPLNAFFVAPRSHAEAAAGQRPSSLLHCHGGSGAWEAALVELAAKVHGGADELAAAVLETVRAMGAAWQMDARSEAPEQVTFQQFPWRMNRWILVCLERRSASVIRECWTTVLLPPRYV